MNKVTCITINVDASFHPQEKVGGYAFWIVCSKFVIKKGGMFKTNPKNSTEAELMGIANAAYTLLKTPDLPYCRLVVVNNDCLNAHEKIGQKSNNKIGKETANIFKQIRGVLYYPGAQTKIHLRHVKAHSGIDDKRSYVNEWCDKEAKKWMREALKIKKQYKNDDI